MKPVLVCSVVAWAVFGWYGGAQAQNGLLIGEVRDAETEAPLAGVTILVQRDSLRVAGTTTDGQGRYRVAGLAGGTVVAVAQSVGYQAEQRTVQLQDDPVRIDFRLRRTVLNLDEVEVSAGRGQEPSDVRGSLFRVAAREALQVAGGSDDVLRVLQTLPGVLATSDFSNQLIVRGGNPDQNLILLDDVEVFNPYRLNGMASLFNPFLIRSVDLYTGGYPAAYGDRLSSVLVVGTRDGTPGRWLSGRANLSLTHTNVVLEGKTGVWNGTWIAGARRTYFDLVTEGVGYYNRILNDIAYPNFADVQGKVMVQPGRGHRVQVQGLYSRDVLDWLVKGELGEQQAGGVRDRLDGDDVTRNAVAGASWTYAPSARLQARVFANWYRLGGTSDFAGGLLPTEETRLGRPGQITPPPVFEPGQELMFSFSQAYAFRKTAAGAVGTMVRGRHEMEAGAGVDVLHNTLNVNLNLNAFGERLFAMLQSTPNWIGALVDSLVTSDPYRRAGAYAQDKWTLFGERFFVQPGLRYDYYEITGRGYWSPRLNASVAVTKRTTLRGAFGLYRQSPGYEKLLDEGEVLNLARYAALEGLTPEIARHAVVGIDYHAAATWNARLEGYWKQLGDLVVQQSGTTSRLRGRYRGTGPRAAASSYYVREQEEPTVLPIPINGADGVAYGLEVLLEKRPSDERSRWSGWLTYAYAKATREEIVDGRRIEYPYEYDRRHAVNAVVHLRLGARRRWQWSTTWRFGTGLPFTPVAGVEPLIGTVADPNDPVRIVNVILADPQTGYARFIPNFSDARNLNTGRMPAYHRLDLRLAYTVPVRARTVEAYLDLVNVYGRKNVLYYRNLIRIEEHVSEGLPESLRRQATPVLYFEPVYMLPFVPTFGVRVSF